MSSPLSPNFNPAYPPFPQQQPASQGPIPGAESFGMPQNGLSGMPQLPQPLPQDTFGAPQPNGAPTPDMQALAQALGQQSGPAGTTGAPPQASPAGAQPSTPQSGIQEYPGGGFAESSSSDGGSLTSSIFSLKGLAIGAATILAGAGLHRVFTGHWIGQAKEVAAHTWESTKTNVESYINNFQDKVKAPINQAISDKNKTALEGLKKSFTDEVITPAETLSTEQAHKDMATTIKTDFTALLQTAENKIAEEKTDALADTEFEKVKESLEKFRDKAATPKAAEELKAKQQAETTTTSTETGTTGKKEDSAASEKDDALTDTDSTTDGITKKDDGTKRETHVPTPKPSVVEPSKTGPAKSSGFVSSISATVTGGIQRIKNAFSFTTKATKEGEQAAKEQTA